MCPLNNYLSLLQVYCSLCYVRVLHVLMGIKNVVIGSDKPQGGTSALLSEDEKKQNVKATYFARPHKRRASDKNLFMRYKMKVYSRRESLQRSFH